MRGGFRNLRVPLSCRILYRRITEPGWYAGEAIDISSTGLQFYGETPLEVGLEVELLLNASIRDKVGELPLTVTYQGRVVRRVLSNWPGVRTATAVRIVQCRVVPGRRENGGNEDQPQPKSADKGPRSGSQ